MDFSFARFTIQGMSPLTQSKAHDEPKLEGEMPQDYDLRTWRSKMTVITVEGKKTMAIPSFGVHLSLIAAARYSKKKIEGQRMATWTSKIERGIGIMADPPLGIDPNEVEPIVLSVNSDGKRGGGTRVIKRFPHIPKGWKATVDVVIMDPIITQAILKEMFELAGLFIGLGQYRPENGGSNGRFLVVGVEWDDRRATLATRKQIAA